MKLDKSAATTAPTAIQAPDQPPATTTTQSPAAPSPARRRVRRQFDPTHPLTHHPSVLLGHENPNSFDFVRQSVNGQFNPKNNYQQILSELAAQNVWRTLRSAAIEAAAIDVQVADQSPQVDREYEEIDSECRTYLALRDPSFTPIRRLLRDDESAYTRRHFQVTDQLKRT